MFKVFIQYFFYELRSIKKSWYKLSLITIFPLVSMFLVIVIFYKGVATQLPMAVVDNDKSKLSRMLLTNIGTSPTIDLSHFVNSSKSAIELVRSGVVYGVIIVPKNFSKDTLLRKEPKVTVMLNTQFILIGKILTAALTSTIVHSSAEIEYVEGLVDLQNPHAALNSISPIKIQITPFFNMYKSYFYFLVSALIPSILQIFIVITSIISLGKVFKYKKEKEVFRDSTNMTAKLLGMMLPYTIVFSLLGLIYLLYIYSMWSFQGSFIFLFFGMTLTVISYQIIGLLFFVTGFDYARALSLGAVYTAPAFAFLGVTFPVNNMNTFAIFWRDILPISHYMELQISQANYGVDIFMDINKIFAIIVFWILFIPIVYMFKKRLSR